MSVSIDAVIHLTTLKGGSYLTGLLYRYTYYIPIRYGNNMTYTIVL